jgi:hypothetical protein
MFAGLHPAGSPTPARRPKSWRCSADLRTAGAAIALGWASGHRLFVGKLPVRTRIFTEGIVFLCVAAFSFLVMIVGGIDLVASMLQLGQESPALRVKMGYVYLAVPISGFFLTLYAVMGLLERLARLRLGPTGPGPESGTGRDIV